MMRRSPSLVRTVILAAALSGVSSCKSGKDSDSGLNEVVDTDSQNLPPAGYLPLNLDDCRSSANAGLEHVSALRQLSVENSATGEPPSACTFAVNFDRTLRNVPILERALIDGDLSVFAAAGGSVSLDSAKRRLFVPFALANAVRPLLDAVLGARSSPTVNTPFYFSGSNLLWRMFGGRHSFSQAKAACASLGPGWVLPTAGQVSDVAKLMTEEVMAMLGPGSTITTQFYLNSVDGGCTEVPNVNVRKCRGNEKIAVCVLDGLAASGG